MLYRGQEGCVFEKLLINNVGFSSLLAPLADGVEGAARKALSALVLLVISLTFSWALLSVGVVGAARNACSVFFLENLYVDFQRGFTKVRVFEVANANSSEP